MDDNLQKRFVYYFAVFSVLVVVAFDFCLLFVAIPDSNKDTVIYVAGSLNTGGVVMIWSFFFGSTASSKEKNETIKNLSEK